MASLMNFRRGQSLLRTASTLPSLSTRIPTAPILPSRLAAPQAFGFVAPFQQRLFFSALTAKYSERLPRTRNIGISAHIDSGKTTLTERILFYSGKITEIHEVKGKDGVGAKMDSMDLEREKGITIQSAATYVSWKGNHINIIDTPGHVDFTIEVERALRVLDGAVLVICSVGGLQSQTFTVDRQMKRYNVPRIVFVNKLDRAGADPLKIVKGIREKLSLYCAAIQFPIGLADKFEGIIDVIENKAIYFLGQRGTEIQVTEVPEHLVKSVEETREDLIQQLIEVDDILAEKVIMEEAVPTSKELKEAVRRATLTRQFAPLMMGSAYKNKGIQLLLDAVIDYLPSPLDQNYKALDSSNDNAPVDISSDPDKPLVGFAFKLDEGKYGQLTYLRVYQGIINKGQSVVNIAQQKRIRIPRIVRMNSNEMEDIDSVGPGEICALFGIDCHSGTTFTDGNPLTMMSMHVPKPVISLSIKNEKKQQDAQFAKALQRFQKEDPTFQVSFNEESKETIISGMGELHLFIYTERMKREYGVSVIAGKPRVAFRETMRKRNEFAYTHKKQTGGAGQYAKISGYLEPLADDDEIVMNNEFVNDLVGMAIPPEFVVSCQKGFEDALTKSHYTGHPIVGVKMVINDGGTHPVDSSDLAFRLCAQFAFRECFLRSNPVVLEPIMLVTITIPSEYQGSVVSGINRRKGIIMNNVASGDYVIIDCEIPLNGMFGYSTDLRSQTQGKGEFSMEYKLHQPAPKDLEAELVAKYQNEKERHTTL